IPAMLHMALLTDGMAASRNAIHIPALKQQPMPYRPMLMIWILTLFLPARQHAGVLIGKVSNIVAAVALYHPQNVLLPAGDLHHIQPMIQAVPIVMAM